MQAVAVTREGAATEEAASDQVTTGGSTAALWSGDSGVGGDECHRLVVGGTQDLALQIAARLPLTTRDPPATHALILFAESMYAVVG